LTSSVREATKGAAASGTEADAITSKAQGTALAVVLGDPGVVTAK
jgi:hypothetical protein